jgi:hypothetical protein
MTDDPKGGTASGSEGDKPKPPDYDPNISIASTDPADEKLNVAPEAKPAESGKDEPKVTEHSGEVPDGTELDAKGEADEPDADDPDKEGDGEEAKPKKKRRRYTNQARINYAMRRAYRAEAENKALKEAADEPGPTAPRPRATAPAKAPVEPKVVKAVAPKRDDFEDVEDFIVARTKFEMSGELDSRLKEERLGHETRLNAERDRVTTAEADEAEAQQLGDWQAAVDKQAVDPATPDFDEVIDASQDVPINAPMRDFMMDSPVGPKLLYELAKNIEVAEQIHSLPPLRALAAMGRLEASLDDAPKSKPAAEPAKVTAPKPAASPTPVSATPEPITPVGGGATTEVVDLDKTDYQTYKRIENAREFGQVSR